jgi:hypothetical protein
MAQVKFYTTTLANLTSSNLDDNALYFVTDTHQIYKGNQAYSGACVKAVASFPASGEVNTLYINTENQQVKFYNGSAYVDVVIPASSINDSDTGFATAQQVYAYVASQITGGTADISKDVDELKKTVAGHTTSIGENADAIAENKSAIDTLNGGATTEGSVAKAVADSASSTLTEAESYTDTEVGKVSKAVSALENGQVATNESNIAALTTRVETAEGDIDTLEASVGQAQTDITSVTSTANANKSALEVLNGTGEGSVSSTAAAAAKSAADSALTEAKSYADTGLDKKADKATTLAGYGITDAYTKGEADSAIATAVANAGHLKREIVSSLQSIDTANEHTIYMVAKSDAVDGQGYDEYMLVNGKFEKIGDSAVSLTGYATEDFVTGRISDASDELTTAIGTAKSEAIDTAGTNADTKISTAIGGLDYTDSAVTGKYVSAVSETDGVIAVTRANLPTYTLTTGSTDGSVAFNGTDVAVKGLGSAAYTASSAYDAAGAADDALSSAKSYADTVASTAETNANAHSDTNLATAKTYAETQANTALSSAKSYTDSALEWQTL